MKPRAITLLSNPKVCAVCLGNLTMNITSPGNQGRHAGARRRGVSIPCPHCAWGLPVVHLPMRSDR